MITTRLWRRRRVLLAVACGLMTVVVVLHFLLSSPSSPKETRGEEVRHLGKWRRNKVSVARVSEEKRADEEEEEPLPPINYDAHIFYYAWYGNKRFNGRYVHWGHARLPHWNRAVAMRYPVHPHRPPEDIAANFYPQLGLYSFLDSTAFAEHFKQIRSTGIGVVVLSWYPPHMADDHGVPNHYILPSLLETAAKFRLKVALHVEPYAKRDPVNLRRHLRYLLSENITTHRAYYRIKSRPVFYLYDSYLTPWNSWSRLLTPHGDLSVRRRDIDGFFIGLFKADDDCQRMADAGFDGTYSYFGVDGFTDGSRTASWPSLVRECRQRGVEFVPCVAPGYDDTAVRPWNAANKRERQHGRYYRLMFESATASGASMLAVTSFNEWHEGTQIEPAIPKNSSQPARTYLDYTPNPPDFYLHLTRAFLNGFSVVQRQKGVGNNN